MKICDFVRLLSELAQIRTPLSTRAYLTMRRRVPLSITKWGRHCLYGKNVSQFGVIFCQMTMKTWCARSTIWATLKYLRTDGVMHCVISRKQGQCGKNLEKRPKFLSLAHTPVSDESILGSDTTLKQK